MSNHGMLHRFITTLRRDIVSAANSQQLQAQQVATAMTEMVASAQEVAQSATRAAGVTSEANKQANQGSAKLRDTVQSIQTVSDHVGNVSDQISRLEGEQSPVLNGIIFFDVIAKLERIGDHLTNIAERVQIEENGGLFG